MNLLKKTNLLIFSKTNFKTQKIKNVRQTLVYFDSKVYSNNFSLFLLTNCFPILNFWETLAQSNYDVFLDYCLLSAKLLLTLIV